MTTTIQKMKEMCMENYALIQNWNLSPLNIMGVQDFQIGLRLVHSLIWYPSSLAIVSIASPCLHMGIFLYSRLFIEGFHVVSLANHGFYGNGSSTIKPFKSLEILSFKDMPEWQKWFLFEGKDEDKYKGTVFSALQELCIIKCPN